MIDKDMMVLQNCTNSENVLVGPYGETYAACQDANQALNIKAEGVSDAEEDTDPVPKTIPEIKVEPEVSCMSVYVHCSLGRYHKCAEISIISICMSVCLCAGNKSTVLTGF
jgi:hypothetical protein